MSSLDGFRCWLRSRCWLAGVLMLCSLASPERIMARMTVDLSGSWQFQIVANLTNPPSSNWSATTVPGYLSSTNYARAWFRKTFLLPSLPTNQRIKLKFGGVKYNSTVYLNGQAVGGCYNGYDAFELDATAAALPGASNELMVAVSDWTTYFSAPVNFANLGPAESARDRANNVILAPIGGHFELFGIWEPVIVEYAPAVSVSEVVVTTSFRQQRLSAKTRLRNESGSPLLATVNHRVRDGTNIVLTLPEQTLDLAAGQTAEVEAQSVWLDPRHWSPEDPFLYSLETIVAAPGQTTDIVTNRFGFREIWTIADKFVLNGVKTKLLAAACWPPTEPISESTIRQALLDVKAGNNKALRLHTQPWPSAWYRIADEVGLLIVEEAAVWCDPRAYRLNDAVFWTNYANHLRAAVRRDANHPSIILWSLENEILHCGGDSLSSGAITNLAQMGLLVKALDPTRPITFEADLDPGGVADVLGLHYPHEFPDFSFWPNTAYWMDQPLAKSYWPGGKWKWDRTKPLYIGEYLWVPDTAPEGLSILFGDAAYFDRSRYRVLAKAWTWQMQIEAYRAYGVSAHCPWTMVEDPASTGIQSINPAQNLLYQAQKAAYEPCVAIPREYDTRFFAGESVFRSVDIYNDTSSNGNFVLEWRINGAPAGSRSFEIAPAEQRLETLALSTPVVSGPFTWDLRLWRDGSVVFSNSVGCASYAPTVLSAPAGRRIALYDPAGATANAFNGISFTVVTNLANAPYYAFDCLVIGRHALKPDSVPSVGSATIGAQWRAFMERGGWVLALEQTNYPAWMPSALSLASEPASFGFPVPGQALAEGLSSTELRWWRGDNSICSSSIRLPTRGNFRPVVHVGSGAGLDRAVLLEAPIGQGGMLCSQLLLVEKLHLEPVAQLLLQRLLNHKSTRSSPHYAGLIAEPDSSAALALNRAGVLTENLSGKLGAAELGRFPLLILAGANNSWIEAAQHLAEIQSYVEGGGTLMVHRPSEAFLTAASSSLLRGASWASDVSLPIVRGDTNPAPAIFSNHDLHWADQAGSWNALEILATNIASRVYRKNFNLASYTTLQVENMPIKTVGGAVAGGWDLWANGYVAQTISIAQAGTYLFGVVARGTPQGGVFPHLVLRIDGAFADAVTVSSTDWQTFSVSAVLSAGAHELALAFDNDAYAPPEDRNLFLDQVRYGLDPAPDVPKFLTKPGVVVETRQGLGRVILNEVAWDAPGLHAIRAERFLSSLITEYGGWARPSGSALKLEAEAMTPVGVASSITNNGIVWLNSSGRLQTTVRFTETGIYVFELSGYGTPAQGVYPKVELLIDGASRGSIELNADAPRSFSIVTNVAAGTHTVQISFINDFYAPPEDRNLGLDFLTIQPQSRPQLVDLYSKPGSGKATLAWLAQPGQPYDVEVSPTLSGPWQRSASLTPAGNVASWTDDGSVVGQPPFTPPRSTGFYRVRLR